MHLINPFWSSGDALPCAWNPNDVSGSPLQFSAGNTRIVNNTSGTIGGVRGTLARASGKWYFEALASVVATVNDSPSIGLITGDSSLDGTWVDGTRWLIQSSPDYCFGPSEYKSSGVTYANGDVYQCAVDFDANKIWFGKNGAWILSGDPASGTNPAWADVSGTLYPWAKLAFSVDVTGRFHLADMQYTVPSGFSAWCAS